MHNCHYLYFSRDIANFSEIFVLSVSKSILIYNYYSDGRILSNLKTNASSLSSLMKFLTSELFYYYFG